MLAFNIGPICRLQAYTCMYIGYNISMFSFSQIPYMFTHTVMFFLLFYWQDFVLCSFPASVFSSFCHLFHLSCFLFYFVVCLPPVFLCCCYLCFYDCLRLSHPPDCDYLCLIILTYPMCIYRAVCLCFVACALIHVSWLFAIVHYLSGLSSRGIPVFRVPGVPPSFHLLVWIYGLVTGLLIATLT